MTLDPLSKKAFSELIQGETDICELIFTHSKTQRACRFFLEWLKTRSGACTRSELSQFGRDLQSGKIELGFTYKRSNFYRLIRRRLLDMGFIALQPRFDYNPSSRQGQYVQKYAPVRQPIPKRGPDGWSFYRLAWELCRKWNEEWEKCR